MPKYTHLFFDLDNTLWDFNANSFIALRVALRKLDLLDKIARYEEYFAVYHEVNERLWALYRDNKISKSILRGLRFEESLEIHGTPMPGMGDTINNVYLEEMPKQTLLVPGALEVLDHVKGRYRIAIITNGFREVQYEKLIQSNIGSYIEKVFISEEIGAQKPHKAIFEHAIKSMNAPKRSSLMIGDSWEADIEGAMNFGIDQVYFQPDPIVLALHREKMGNEIRRNSTNFVLSLKELLTIL